MAAYEKQQPQPQPQPQPHLNGAYYGTPIPQQPARPAYYAPPPRGPRRSGPCCFFCCLFKVIALVVIALGAASLVLWLVFRPGSVRASAASATLSRFDLVDGPGGVGGGGGPRGRGGSEQLLQYNLTVDIRVRNPNRFGIHYDNADAQASYDDERFGLDSVQPFYLDSNGEHMITATFGGSSPVDDDDDVVRTYRREKSDGFYFVRVRVKADVGFKVRVFNIRRKNRITCTLRLPVHSSDLTPVTTQLGTRCAVDF